jgi:hypothetical protein
MARLVRNDTPDGIECLKSKTFGHLEVLWYSEFIKRGKSYVHWWAVECEKCGKRFRQTTEQLLGDVLELSFCRSCPVQERKQINRYAKIQNLGRKKLAKKPLKNRSPAALRTKKPQLPKGARDLRGKRFGDLSVIKFSHLREIQPKRTLNSVQQIDALLASAHMDKQFAEIMDSARATADGSLRADRVQEKIDELTLNRLSIVKQSNYLPSTIYYWICRCEQCGRFDIRVNQSDLLSGRQNACLRCEPPNKHLRK